MPVGGEHIRISGRCSIEVLDHHVVYTNPIPHIRSRHAYFPGLVQLPNDDLLGLFALGEAMDATNVTTMVTRSTDDGRTWTLQGPLHEKAPEHEHEYDSDYLKPNLLADGSLVATGYRFQRSDPDSPIGNPETGGIREGDNLVSWSQDEGHTWTHPAVMETTRPELVEAAGASVQLRDGRIVIVGRSFHSGTAAHPSGRTGVLLASRDGGRSWDDRSLFYEDAAGRHSPSEPRLCEMADGRLVVLIWMYADDDGTSLANHFAVSHDGGESWGTAIDTGIMAQASNLMALDGDLLLSVHAHREGEVGLVVRIVDLTGDRWQVLSEKTVWGETRSSQTGTFREMALNLKFGQPSLLRLANGEILATHWAVIDGLGQILTHRFRVQV